MNKLAQFLKENNISLEDVQKLLLKPKSDYKCNACGHSFPADKRRKSCPSCKSKKISTSVVPTEDQSYIHKSDPQPIPENPQSEDGRKYTRKQNIQISNKNLYEDNVDEHAVAKDDTKYLPKKLTPRDRRPYKPVQIKCTNCGKQREIHPSLLRERDRSVWICDSCLKNRR